MKTLHLNLKRKWFDMILSGEKKEEYREIKWHWFIRFIYYKEYVTEDQKYQFLCKLKHTHSSELIRVFNRYGARFREFDSILFSNGYGKHCPKLKFNLNDIRVGFGLEEWGADPLERCFIIKLGEIIK